MGEAHPALARFVAPQGDAAQSFSREKAFSTWCRRAWISLSQGGGSTMPNLGGVCTVQPWHSKAARSGAET